MAEDLLYLDSSAIVKLVLREAETQALMESLIRWPNQVSSNLAIVDVERAVRRVSKDETFLRRAREVLASLNLLRLDREVLELATHLEPRGLRSLDAIHLASALSLKADLGALAVYDRRLAEAAQGLGIRVLTPR